MKILYLSSIFPLISENFIFNEMAGLIKLGADIKILSMNKPVGDKFSEAPKRHGFDDRVVYTSEVKLPCKNRKLRSLYLMMRLALKMRFGAVIKLLTDGTNNFEYSRSSLLELGYQIEKVMPDADILFCHFGPLGRLGAILKHYGLVDQKVVTTFHGYDISRYLKENPGNPYDILFRHADMMFCVSEFFRQKLISIGASEQKSQVLHTAIDCDKFHFKEPVLKKPNDTIRFVSVGRFTEKKGHVYMVKAFKELLDKNTTYKFHLDLIGEGELFQEIKELSVSLGVADHITFHGAQQHDDVQRILSESDIFILPSVVAEDGDTEGIPGSIMEAMSSGKIVVSTVHTGIPELVEDGKTGFLAEERDISGLCAKMMEAIDAQDRWKQMAIDARETVLSDFETKSTLKKLYSILEGVCK